MQVHIDPYLLFPNPDQPRKHFDEESIRELADSIQQHGLIQPIVVVRMEPEEAKKRIAQLPEAVRQMFYAEGADHMIVAGERRWRAFLLLRKDQATRKWPPCIVRTKLTDEAVFELALTENVNRESMLPMEEANGLARMRDEFGYSTKLIAVKIGRSPDFVRGRLALLNLDLDLQALVNGKHIPLTVAISISRLTSDRQHKVVKAVNEDALNAMEACFMADQLLVEQDQGHLFDLAAFMQERAAEAAAKWLANAQTVTEKVKDALTTAIEQLPLPDLETLSMQVQERIAAMVASPAPAGAEGPLPGEFPMCALCEHSAIEGFPCPCTSTDAPLDGETCFREYIPTLAELIESEARKEEMVKAMIGSRAGRTITDQVKVFVMKTVTSQEGLGSLGLEEEKEHHLEIIVQRGADILFTLSVAEQAEGNMADIYLDADFGVGEDRWKGITFALEADHHHYLTPLEGGESLFREAEEDG